VLQGRVTGACLLEVSVASVFCARVVTLSECLSSWIILLMASNHMVANQAMEGPMQARATSATSTLAQGESV
jgi:hypothetical protein